MKTENLKIKRQLWIKGTPEDVKRIIESLQDQGYERVEEVPIAFNKEVLVLE